MAERIPWRVGQACSSRPQQVHHSDDQQSCNSHLSACFSVHVPELNAEDIGVHRQTFQQKKEIAAACCALCLKYVSTQAETPTKYSISQIVSASPRHTGAYGKVWEKVRSITICYEEV